MIISLSQIELSYGTKKNPVHALKNVSLQVDEGEFLVIMGKSGCGKSSLLNVLGTIRKSNSGKYIFDGQEVHMMSDTKLAKFRNENIGFVVQHFALINSMTVADNICLPLSYMGVNKKEQLRRMDELLQKLDLVEKKNNYPNELSGGQQQRVAIARALITQPKLLLADEPTGALDEETGKSIMNLLREVNQSGTTIIMVTHDNDYANWGSKCIHMKDGEIIENGDIA